MKCLGIIALTVLFPCIISASPDSRDSIILESKQVKPGTGKPYTTVRVWITNKDTLSSVALPLIEKSISGGAYMTLSYPRNFSGVVNPLTSTLQGGSSIFAGNRYNSSSPDSFTVVGFFDPTDPNSYEPPNSTRKPFWDIKFDSVWSSPGTIQFDSIRIITTSVEFVDKYDTEVPVDFVSSTITVNPNLPDPQDSVILETKLVNPGVGSPYTSLRVWITNKDTLSNLTLPLLERSVSGGAYMTLSWPRSFAGVVHPLTATLQGSTLFSGDGYNNTSPDSFSLTGSADPLDNNTFEPPNLTRKAFWDIKFDSVWLPNGAIEFDSATVASSFIHFVDKHNNVIYSNFSKGLVNVSPATVIAVGAPRYGISPLRVFFSALATAPVTQWNWSFGDGATDTVQNPIHVYSDTGYFSVTVQATQGGKTITVSLPNYIRVKSVKANFSGTPRLGEVPLSVNFTDLSIGNPTAWSWNFGDGATSSMQNPNHIYNDTGRYQVTLIASNAIEADTARFLNYVHAQRTLIPDFEVYLFGTSRARPGFTKVYDINLYNIGSGTSSGGNKLFFVKPNQGTFAPPITGVISGDTESWVLGPLAPSYSPLQYSIPILFPPQTPPGVTAEAKAIVQPAAFEVNLSNNEADDGEPIVASSDPNDMFVNPVGCRVERAIQGNERLAYTVHFENSPNASANATYVLVVDTLDANLDWNTLQIGPTSHDSVLTVNFNSFTGELAWFFNNINLPPNVNPPQGEGFVTYSILPKAGLSNNTVLTSRAHVRFDYNPWVDSPENGPLSLSVDPAATTKGDMNASGDLTPTDVVMMLNCVFLSIGTCDLCFADVNCSGDLSPTDVVLELNKVFLSAPFPCN